MDTWAKEDASDRLEDIENLKDAMKREERNSTNNRAEFTRVVKVGMEGDQILRRRTSAVAITITSLALPPVILFQLFANALGAFGM